MSVVGSPLSVDARLVPRISDSVAWAEVDGEAVLYDELRQKVHVLSPTAALVWSGIDGTTSLERIAEELSEAFDIGLDVVRADVLELAGDLMAKGLIGEAGSAPPRVGTDRSAPPRPGPRFLEEPPGG